MIRFILANIALLFLIVALLMAAFAGDASPIPPRHHIER